MKVGTFVIGTEEYAVELSRIREILHVSPITRVPGFDAVFEGVFNHREQVVPVICLRKKFGLPGGLFDEHTRIIVIESRGIAIGFIVDAMGKIFEADVEPFSNNSPHPASEGAQVQGIIQTTGKPIPLLNPDAVGLRPEISQNTKVHNRERGL